MSLTSFQRVLCDLIASPNLCLRLRADSDATLAHYDLSVRERKRLATVVWQRGMSTNCTLYRSNRITPIYTLLHYTCLSLGGQFGTLIDQFWEAKDYQDGQFKSEVERFGVFLRQRIAAGAVASPFAGELLAFELARNALEFSPRKEVLRTLAHLPPLHADTPCRLHPLARLVHFRHDPAVLLGTAGRGTMPPPDLPVVEALVVLSVVDGALTIMQLADGMHCGCDDTASTIVAWPMAQLAPELAVAGLLVPLAAADGSRAAADQVSGSESPIDGSSANV
jgi:hypothetical protein